MAEVPNEMKKTKTEEAREREREGEMGATGEMEDR